MKNIIRQHSPAFKAQVALDMIREIDTKAVICSTHGIHPTQANRWKALAIDGLTSVFSNQPMAQLQEKDHLIEELYKQIGKQKVELDWLKKKSNSR